MDVVLLAGLWLPASVWADVGAALTTLGHRPIVPGLPGVDDRSPTATLADQVTVVVDAVDAADRPVVVGHSAASTLAWITADRRPTDVAGVVMVGGFPNAPGSAYAPFFDVVDGVMPFPGWEPFEGADSVDLDDAARAGIEAVAVPVPAGVARAVVQLGDDRRYDVPVTLVCPEFGAADVAAWIEAGELPELVAATRVSFVDIETGHWPMISAPDVLARAIAEIAESLDPP